MAPKFPPFITKLIPGLPKDKVLLVSPPPAPESICEQADRTFLDSWAARCILIKNIGTSEAPPKLDKMSIAEAAEYVREALNDIAMRYDGLVKSMPFKEIKLSERTIAALRISSRPVPIKPGKGVVFVDYMYDTLPVVEVSEEEEAEFLKELAAYADSRVSEVR